MAKAQNTFLRSKMNRDIDARILPSGEYRYALNAQISRSEGDGVGSLENVLGNSLAADFETLEGVTNLTCIGYFADDINNNIYLFLTDYTDPAPVTLTYSPSAKNFIYSYNTITGQAIKLVEGEFLNFSKTHYIYGTSLLEDVLFFTDNRNQPRRVNVVLASEDSTYYTTEDQISVSTYNPYQAIQLFQESNLASSGTDQKFETTMLDVVSKFYPNGGTADATSSSYTAGTDIPVSNYIGKIYVSSEVKGSGSSTVPTGTTVTAIDTSANTIQLDNDVVIGSDPEDVELIFEPNPYYDASYNGDPNYLEDKFVRFSYRFNYVDGENSIFAPFTQPAFIPKQDGYFVKVTPTGSSTENDDQKEAYQSTVVEFMENKVNKILLYIPLPFKNFNLSNSLKVNSLEILYKESNQTAVKVIEEIDINTITNSSALAQVNGLVPGASEFFNIDNIKGGITEGAFVSGPGVPFNVTVVAYTPTSTSNPNLGGQLQVTPAITLDDNVTLTIGNPDFYVYNYQSRKPTKVLPESELIRVYDKTPVRALAQEIISNRVVYGNFQNKHTPPASLDYNVNASDKAAFNTNSGTGTITGSGGTVGGNTITVNTKVGDIWTGGNVVGCIITTNAIGATIPDGTLISAFDESTGQLTLTNNVTIAAADIIIITPGSTTQNTTSIIEYPNHSLKENRNYQVGIVLSDKFGRQSSVILSNSLNSVNVNNVEFVGSTIYSPYQGIGETPSEWPGDSLKISFNSTIAPAIKNTRTGWPGLYNDDITSSLYNPLGWYSWKIVVKQTEQEYYNVYLPGIMAAYPTDTVLELGKTSHAVLINDNINKVPRDLSEVGPQQKQFRSSVQLFGRVQNLNNTIGTNEYNTQYYPGIKSDTVAIISTVEEMFDFTPNTAPRPDLFPQFYSFESNPLIARITTQSQIGQIASTNFLTSSGQVDGLATGLADTQIALKNYEGPADNVSITAGFKARGGGLPTNAELAAVIDGTLATPIATFTSSVSLPPDAIVSFFQPTQPGIQYLAVYETEPVESLLDIFWETSSSGLISDLNDAVLFDNLGAAAFSNFNTTNFTEQIKIGDPLNNVTFQVSDIFGADLAGGTFSLEIQSIFDQSGTDLGSTGLDVFTLEEPSSGNFNLKTNVLWVYNENPNPRTVNIDFKVTILADGSTFILSEIAELQNVAPSFINCPGVGVVTTIEQLDTIVIEKLEAKNGSRFFDDGTTGATGNKFRSGEGLQWRITSQYGLTALESGFATSEQQLIDEYNAYIETVGVVGSGDYEGNPADSASGNVNNTFNVNQFRLFSIVPTIVPDNTINNGVSFITIVKNAQFDSQYAYLTDEAQQNGIPYVLNLELTDANGASEFTDTCRVEIRVMPSIVQKAWSVDMSSPKTLATGTDLYVDATAEVDTVIDITNFTLKNLTGANVPSGTYGTLNGQLGFGGGPSLNVAGPIFTGGYGEGDDISLVDIPGLNPLEGQSTGFFNQVYGPVGRGWWPNAKILDSANVEKAQVKAVEYTDPCDPGEFTYCSDFGSLANVETFEPHNLSPGDQIKFTSGRWQVSTVNSHGVTCNALSFPNVRWPNCFFEYYLPGTTTVAQFSDFQYTNLKRCTSSPSANGGEIICAEIEEIDNVVSICPFETNIFQGGQMPIIPNPVGGSLFYSNCSGWYIGGEDQCNP